MACPIDLPSALTSARAIRRPTHKNDPMIRRNGNQDTIKLTNQGTSSCISVSIFTARLSNCLEILLGAGSAGPARPLSATGQQTLHQVIHLFELLPMLVNDLADRLAVKADKRAGDPPPHPNHRADHHNKRQRRDDQAEPPRRRLRHRYPPLRPNSFV